jgi:hypothetical protein
MKACRLSSKTFCLLIFSFFSNNILLHRYLLVVNVLGRAWQFRRTISTRPGKSQSYPRPFSPSTTICLRRRFLFSFVHRYRTLFGPPIHLSTCYFPCSPLLTTATTRSRPVRAAQIQRGLYAVEAWTIGWQSWPVPERVFFLFLLRPGRTGGTAW